MIFGLRQRLAPQVNYFDDTDAMAKVFIDRCHVVTVISALIILYLVLSEFMAYRTPTWNPELLVDKGRKEKMSIYFNITFPKMPCHST